MTARRDRSYAGAAGTVIQPEQLPELGSGYVAQPKMDGIYGLVSTDRAGRISAIVTRAGKLLGPQLLSHFAGVRWMPDSTIVAEVELWTENSNRVADARGYRMLHAFDCERIAGKNVSRESYRVRRDALLRAQVELENRGDDRPWVEDDVGDFHDLKTGRYAKPIPKGWRRVAIVPQLPVARASEAWTSWVDHQEAGPAEGLVAVSLDAQLGKARSKLKAKRADTLDAVVVSVSPRALTTFWTAGQQRVTVSRPKSLDVAVGQVVALSYEGFHDSGEPRFARVARVRCDLAA